MKNVQIIIYPTSSEKTIVYNNLSNVFVFSLFGGNLPIKTIHPFLYEYGINTYKFDHFYDSTNFTNVFSDLKEGQDVFIYFHRSLSFSIDITLSYLPEIFYLTSDLDLLTIRINISNQTSRNNSESILYLKRINLTIRNNLNLIKFKYILADESYIGGSIIESPQVEIISSRTSNNYDLGTNCFSNNTKVSLFVFRIPISFNFFENNIQILDIHSLFHIYHSSQFPFENFQLFFLIEIEQPVFQISISFQGQIPNLFTIGFKTIERDISRLILNVSGSSTQNSRINLLYFGRLL